MKLIVTSYQFGFGNLQIDDSVKVDFLDKNHTFSKVILKISDLLGNLFPGLKRIQFQEENYINKDGMVQQCRASISKAELNRFIERECKQQGVNTAGLKEKFLFDLKGNSLKFRTFGDDVLKEIERLKNIAKPEEAPKAVESEKPKLESTKIEPKTSEPKVEIKKAEAATSMKEVTSLEKDIGGIKVILKRADITKEDFEGQVGAIVNAANNQMLGGSGVDGAIHAAGGKEIKKECEKYPILNPRTNSRCETGQAKITGAGKLRVSYVIHAVGPDIRGIGITPTTEKQLKDAHLNSLRLAEQNDVSVVSFPVISIGVYEYPYKEASETAFAAISEFAKEKSSVKEIRFLIFHEDKVEEMKIFNVYKNTLEFP